MPENEPFADHLLSTVVGGVNHKRKSVNRIDYTRSYNREKMNATIKEFLDLPHTPTEKDPYSRGAYSRNKFAAEKGVPPSTFRRRIEAPDPFCTPAIGRKSLLGPMEKRAIADSVAVRDEHNHGIGVSSILDSMEKTFTKFSRKQLSNAWQRTIKKDPRLTQPVVADRFCQTRTAAVTEIAQRNWFFLVRDTRRMLEQKSLGVDSTSGKRYAELRSHFIAGCDEEGIQLSITQRKIVGKYGKAHHYKNSEDSRKSATAVRTGSAVGKKGPSIYILSTQNRQKYIDTNFLVRNGAPSGSIYTVNSSAYMTDETWDATVEDFCKALRTMDPIIARNPNWWMEFHVDGFKSHVNTVKAQRTFYAYKILIIQSQSHTSHVNQSFDDEPARISKKSQREWLPQIRTAAHMFQVSNEDDQLLLAMLESEKDITGGHWKEGFRNVNLNPDTTLPIEVWLSKISSHLTASGDIGRLLSHNIKMSEEEIKLEYNLRFLKSIKPPALYNALSDADKTTVMNIFRDKNGSSWDAGNLSDVFNEHDDLLKQKLKLDQGSHLHKLYRYIQAMDEAVNLNVASPSDVLPNLEAAKAKRNQAYVQLLAQSALVGAAKDDIGAGCSSDLSTFSIKKQVGEDSNAHFKRICWLRRLGGFKGQGPLNIEVSMEQEGKKGMIMPSEEEIALGSMLKEANKRHKKPPGARMNQFGELPGFCKVANTEHRLRKMEKKAVVDAFVVKLKEAREKADEEAKRILAAEKAAVQKRADMRAEKKLEHAEAQSRVKALLKVIPSCKNGEYGSKQLKEYAKHTLDMDLSHLSKTILWTFLLKVQKKVEGGLELKTAAGVVVAEMNIEVKKHKTNKRETGERKKKKFRTQDDESDSDAESDEEDLSFSEESEGERDSNSSSNSSSSSNTHAADKTELIEKDQKKYGVSENESGSTSSSSSSSSHAAKKTEAIPDPDQKRRKFEAQKKANVERNKEAMMKLNLMRPMAGWFDEKDQKKSAAREGPKKRRRSSSPSRNGPGRCNNMQLRLRKRREVNYTDDGRELEAGNNNATAVTSNSSGGGSSSGSSSNSSGQRAAPLVPWFKLGSTVWVWDEDGTPEGQNVNDGDRWWSTFEGTVVRKKSKNTFVIDFANDAEGQKADDGECEYDYDIDRIFKSQEAAQYDLDRELEQKTSSS